MKPSKKARASKLLTPILIILIFLWITILSSCAIFVRGPHNDEHRGFDKNRGRIEHRRGGNEHRRGDNEHRGGDNRQGGDNDHHDKEF